MKQETFDKTMKLAIGGVTAVTSMVVGSTFGTSGTIAGTFSGAVVSGLSSEAYTLLAERGRRHASRLPDHVRKAGAIAGIAAVGLPVGLTAVEAAAAKPLTSIVTGRQEHGTTLTGTAPGPAPSPRPSVTVSVFPTGTPGSTDLSGVPVSPSVTESPTSTITVVPSPSVTVTPTLIPTLVPATPTAGG